MRPAPDLPWRNHLSGPTGRAILILEGTRVMAEMKSKTVAALGSLAVLIGAVPGLIGSALAIDQGQILILSNGKGKATGPRAAISQSGSGDQPGAVVIVPIDGEVRVIGLQAGLYTIQVSGSAEANAVKVEADGRLAFAGYQAARPGQRTDTAATGRRKPVDPIVRTWAEQVAFGGPCDEPRTCLNLADAIDLNSAQRRRDRTADRHRNAIGGAAG